MGVSLLVAARDDNNPSPPKDCRLGTDDERLADDEIELLAAKAEGFCGVP
jgi:hypothetical protein